MKTYTFKPKKLVSFCVVFLIGLFTTIPALALNFNGSSGSSGGGGTSSNGYAVNTDGSALIGFRFSLVNSSNTQRENSVDIVTNGNYNTYKSYKKFDLKYCKTEWVKYYSSITGITTSVNNTNFYNGSSLGFASNLPKISNSDDLDNLSSNLNKWQKDVDNIDVILKKIGDSEVNDSSKLGNNKIVIEPLFSIALEGGSDHILTMTEIAVYGGGYEYYGNFSTVPNYSSDITWSWEFISSYTNKYFPNYMRTGTADCNWGEAPELNKRASFETIITKGYGANVLSSSSVSPKTYTIEYNANGGTGTMTKTTVTYGVSTEIKDNEFTRTGYTFGGWHAYRESDGKWLYTYNDAAAWYEKGSQPSGATLRVYNDGTKVSKSTNVDGDTIVLYAQWDVNKVQIKYIPNGGTVSDDDYKLSGTGGSIFQKDPSTNTFHTFNHGASEDPYNATTFGLTKAGYTFGGWKVASTGITLDQDTNYSSTKYADVNDSSKTSANTSLVTCHLEAVWVPKTYTIEYNANGGTGTMANTPATYDVSTTLRANAFTRTGYTFNGWNTKADGSGTPYANKASVKNLTTSSGGTVTLYAQWDVNKVQIKYIPNGGTVSDDDYKLSGTGGSIFQKDPSTNTFHTFNHGASEGPYNAATFGLTKAGYTFGGWKVVSTGEILDQNTSYSSTKYADVDDSSKTSANTSLVTCHLEAVWIENTLTVNYYSNYADKSFASALNAVAADKNVLVRTVVYNYSTKYDDGLYNYTKTSSTTYLGRTGFTATGKWGTTTSGGVLVDQDTSFASGQALAVALGKDISSGSATVNVCAQWTENTLTVVYHSNGADSIKYAGVAKTEEHLVNNMTQTFKYSTTNSNGLRNGDNADALFLTKNGHAFSGYWLVGSTNSATKIDQNLSGNGQELAVAMGTTIANGSKTVDVFAEWAQTTFTVSYDANGGSGAPENQGKAVDVDLTLSPVVPDKEGDYIFSSWNTAQDGTGDVYFPEGIYSKDLDAVLYAQWKNTESIALKGLGYATIKVGDVFEPLNHLDKFNISDDLNVVATKVIYNNVPRDADNKATTSGTGYTVVYNMSFDDGTIGQYRLVVTVLDGAVTPSLKGYIRSISLKHLSTLETHSKWRLGELKERLEKTLGIKKPTDENAIEVWHFKPENIQEVKKWVNESETAGKSREEQNAEFGIKFGKYQTKGKYASGE